MSHDRKEAYDRRNARNNPRKVIGASGYVGMAPRADQAAELNQLAREERAKRREQHGSTG